MGPLPLILAAGGEMMRSLVGSVRGRLCGAPVVGEAGATARGVLLASLLVAGALAGSAAPAPVAAQQPDSARARQAALDTAALRSDFTAPAPAREPLALDAAEKGVRLGLEILKWGGSMMGPDTARSFRLSLVDPPPYLLNVRWSADRVTVEPGQESVEVALEFDVDSVVATGGAQDTAALVIRVAAEDPAVQPRERLIRLPLALRPRLPAQVTAYPESWVLEEGSNERPTVTEADAHRYVDTRADPLLQDRIWVFFTPARDTTATEWAFRILDGAGQTVAGGTFSPNDTAGFRAAPDAPGAFAVRLQDWGWGDHTGTFRVETCPVGTTSGLWGQPSGYHILCENPVGDTLEEGEEAPPAEEWQLEGTFEVGEVRLHRKGVVTEQGALPFGEGQNLNGRMSLEQAAEGDGVQVVLRLEEDACTNPARPGVHPSPPCDSVGPGWRQERLVHRFRFTADVPPVLDLRTKVPAEFRARLDPLEGDPRPRVRAEIHDLAPRASGPHRELGERGIGEGLLDLRKGPGPEPPDSADPGRMATLSEMGNRPATTPPPPLSPGTDPVTMHLYNGDVLDVGHPFRPTGDWLRNPEVQWYVPVEFSYGSLKLFAFVVYGTEPGPYAGALPTVSGAAGPVVATGEREDPADTQGEPGTGEPGAGQPGTGETDEATTDPEADPAGEENEPGGGAGGTGGVGQPGGPVDPAALDPASPDIGGLIRTWISVARPPMAAEPDNNVRYDEWGRVVGRTATMVTDVRGPPDGRGAMQPVEYVWTLRDDLDSVDHCTLEEYVVRSLEERGLAECRGRYTASPPVPDEPARHTVVGVYGLTFQDARAILADSGFVVAPPVGGDPAPTEDMAFRVAAQSVPGGQARDEGAEIRLTLFGPFRPEGETPQPDPTPRPPEPRGPSCNDLVLAANRAQGRGDLSGAYELYRTALGQGCRNPGLRDAMESVYQSPRCTRLIQQARAAYDRDDFQSAVRTLRSAEREDCDMSGLGPLVNGSLQGLETGVAEALGRSCSGLAAEIAAARRSGQEATAQALTTTALMQGCSGQEITAAASTPLGQPSGQGEETGGGAGPPPQGGGEEVCYNVAGATVFGQDPPSDAVMFIYEERAGDRRMYHVIEQYNIGFLDRLAEFGGEMRRLDWEGSYPEAVEYVKRLCGGGS